MELNWRLPQGNTSLSSDDQLYQYLKIMEVDSQAELLAPTLVNGNVTIGVGFDLVAGGPDVQNFVFEGLGLDPAVLKLTAAPTAGTSKASEYGFVQSLRNAISHGDPDQLSVIMAARARLASTNTAYHDYLGTLGAPVHSSFQFSNEAEVRSVYDNILPGYLQDKLWSIYPDLKNNSSFNASREKMVMVDLAWNGGTGLIGSTTTFYHAIQSGNRALAWYEIRYGSNKGGDKGLAKRRYFESQVFGLYDEASGPVSPAEALQAYQVLTQHRADIFAYERKYGYTPDGAAGTVHDKQNRLAIDAAAQDYSSLTNAGFPTPQRLDVAFQEAENALFKQLRSVYSNDSEVLSILNNESQFNATNIYVSASNSVTLGSGQTLNVGSLPGSVTTGDNLLMGGAGKDTLIGGAGSDLLIAGTGLDVLQGGVGDDTLIGGNNDTLNGGTGDDTFVIQSGASNAGTTMLTSALGVGSIWLDGNSAALGSGLIRVEDLTQQDTWIDTNGLQYQFTSANGSSTGTLKISGGSLGAGEVDIQNFDLEFAENNPDGYLGIVIPKGIALAPGVVVGGSGSGGGGGSYPSITLTSGGEQTYTLALDAPTITAQSITLKLSGGTAADYGINVAGTVQPLSSGSVTVTIPAGSQSVTFSLVNTKPLDAAESISLTATLSSSGPNAAAITSNALSVNVNAGMPNPHVTAPITNSIITGRLGVFGVPSNVTAYVGDNLNDAIIVADDAPSLITAGDGNESILGGADQDIVTIGNGNSVIVGNGGGDQFVVGDGSNQIYLLTANATGLTSDNSSQPAGSILMGDGNNTIVSGAQNEGIYAGSATSLLAPDGLYFMTGGSGNNVISGVGAGDSSNTSTTVLGNGNNQIYAGAKIDIATAIAQAEASVSASSSGSGLIVVGNGNNTIVGGNGLGRIAVGTGNNLIIGGAGNSDIDCGVIATGQIDLALNIGDADTISTGIVGDASYSPPSTYEGVIVSVSSSGYTLNEGTAASLSATTQAVGMGNNTIFGGVGDRNIWLSNGDNYVDASGGNEQIVGGMGNDTIYGSRGDVTVFGGGGNTYIDGESGNDILIGQGGNNTIYGGSGDSLLYAGKSGQDWADSYSGLGYSNYVFGGAGNVTIHGSGGSDTLIGGSGDDFIWGGNGTEYIETGNGNTQVVAGTGDTTIIGGNGSDSIVGGSGTNVLHAGDGGTATSATQVRAGSGDTTIYGGQGVDHLYGGYGAGSTVIYAGDGGTLDAATQVTAGSSDTTIYGGLGVDNLFGGSGNNVIYAGDGGTDATPTYVLVGSGSTTVYGGAGVDQIQGGTGSNVLYAGSGSASVFGGTGNSTLVAGSGNSYLVNQSASSVDLINSDAGNVEVVTNSGPIELQFGAGITASDLTALATIGSDGSEALEIDGAGSVTIDGGLTGNFGTATFADGSHLSYQQLLTAVTPSSNTVTIGSSDFVFSTLSGDVLVGGTGNDTLSGWGNNDTLAAGSGNQQLFAAGADVLLRAGSGNDTLTAGAGNATLVAGTGTNSLVGGRADDLFELTDGGLAEIQSTTSNGVETIRLPDGMTLSDFNATRLGLDLVLQSDSGSASVVVKSFYDTQPATRQWLVADNVNGAQSLMAWAAQQAQQRTTYAASVAAAEIAFDISQRISLQLTGNTGGNVLGAFLQAGSGNGTVYGGEANDFIAAGLGFNSLKGGRGSNTYYVPLSGVASEIVDNDSTQVTQPSTSTSTLVIPTGITPQEIGFRWVTDPNSGQPLLELSVGQSSVEIVTYTSFYVQGGHPFYVQHGLQAFQFTDSMGQAFTLTQDQLLAQATLLPDDYNPTVTSEANLIVGVQQAIAASSMFTASDTGTNTISWYQFQNQGTGAGYFTVNGVQQTAGQPFYVSGAQLDTVEYVGGNTGDADSLEISAFDGAVWSALASTTVNVAGVSPPKTYTDTVDDNGVKTGDTWTATDGSYGSDTLYSDGSSQGTSYDVNGLPTTSYGTDAAGNSTVYSYTAGVLSSDTRHNSDGSYGTDTFNADGSSSSTTHYPSGNSVTTTQTADGQRQTVYTNTDGSTETDTYVAGVITERVTNDGNGNTSTTSYNAAGSSIAHTQSANGNSSVATRDADNSGETIYTNADGSSEMDTYLAGFITVRATDDGNGYNSSTSYSGDGSSVTNTQSADGSHSVETDNADGSSSRSVYRANGDRIDTTRDATSSGQTVYTNADGSTEADTYMSGTVTRDDWTSTDGSYGDVIYSADGSLISSTYRPNGDSSVRTTDANNNSQVVSTNADGSTQTANYIGGVESSDSWTSPDGAYGSSTTTAEGLVVGEAHFPDGRINSYSLDANGSGQRTYQTADGSVSIETYVNKIVVADVWTGIDGSHTDNTYYADGSSSGDAFHVDGSTSRYSLDSVGDRHRLYAGATGVTLDHPGTGSDTFTFARGSGSTDIVETLSASSTDQIHFAPDIAANQLWFERAGDDLVIDIIGTGDNERITDWYQGATHQVAQIDAGDGQILLASQVDNLVSAMAAFAPPSAGQTTLPADYQTALAPVLAANWH